MNGDISILDCLKILEARRLIEASDLPLDSIARKLGFSDLDEFQSKFFRIEGQKPLAIRNRDD